MTSGPDFTDPLNPAARTIAYNADNMPETVTHSANGTTTLLYDGESQRVKKTAGGSATYYINKYFEVEGTSEIKYVFAGNQRIARIAVAGTRYFHQDHLGSATVVTDATGAQVEGSEYLPFGGERSHSGTVQAPYKFTDQELDNSTGLYNYDARLYDPGIGQFASADNLKNYTYNPKNINSYAYCLNNPLAYTDPTGHWAVMGGLSGRAIGPGLSVEAGVVGIIGSEGKTVKGEVSTYAEAFAGGGLSAGRGPWGGAFTGDISDLEDATEIGIDTPFGSFSAIFNMNEMEFGFTIGGPAIGAGAFAKQNPLHIKKEKKIAQKTFKDQPYSEIGWGAKAQPDLPKEDGGNSENEPNEEADESASAEE